MAQSVPVDARCGRDSGSCLCAARRRSRGAADAGVESRVASPWCVARRRSLTAVRLDPLGSDVGPRAGRVGKCQAGTFRLGWRLSLAASGHQRHIPTGWIDDRQGWVCPLTRRVYRCAAPHPRGRLADTSLADRALLPGLVPVRATRSSPGGGAQRSLFCGRCTRTINAIPTIATTAMTARQVGSAHSPPLPAASTTLNPNPAAASSEIVTSAIRLIFAWVAATMPLLHPQWVRCLLNAVAPPAAEVDSRPKYRLNLKCRTVLLSGAGWIGDTVVATNIRRVSVRDGHGGCAGLGHMGVSVTHSADAPRVGFRVLLVPRTRTRPSLRSGRE